MDNRQHQDVGNTEAPKQTQTAGLESSDTTGAQLSIKKKKSKIIKKIAIAILSLIVLITLIFGVLYMWYRANLQPPQSVAGDAQQIIIENGSTTNSIAQLLEDKGVIQNATVFQIYYRLHGEKHLQAGEYSLRNTMSVPEVIYELSEGKKREYSLTFLPGENLMDIKKTLLEAGFDAAEITKAFENKYPSYGMMQSRSDNVDIEGFVFPDTYRFGDRYTVEDILKRPFDYMQEYIDTNNLESAYKKHGLSLYQGIILASVIQKEVNSQSDMSHVSQVFHSRLKMGMPLGSDPTFVYPAKKMGVAPHPDLDSPYNTYKITGLPPGPIANPGKEALYAAANPSTDTDDLYFVAGDDGKTHFSKTNDEHEALTQKYCKERCRLDIF